MLISRTPPYGCELPALACTLRQHKWGAGAIALRVLYSASAEREAYRRSIGQEATSEEASANSAGTASAATEISDGGSREPSATLADPCSVHICSVNPILTERVEKPVQEWAAGSVRFASATT